jgi:hypothetical protein
MLSGRAVPLATRSSHIHPTARITPTMNTFVRIVLAGGLALGLGLSLSAPVLAQECLSRNEIQQKIDSGEVRQLAEALQAAGENGRIISQQAQLCLVGGQWEWQVNVMDSNGESRPVSLPAT